MKNLKIYAFIIFIFYACNVSKDINKPTPELPQTFRNATANADTASIAAIPWKTFFTDTTLQHLIDSALEKNYDMQLAVKNIESSQLLMKQTKLLYLPEANLQITGGTTRYSDNSLNGLTANQYLGTKHIEDYNASIAVSWEADIWNKIKNRKSIALAQYLQTTEARIAVQTNLIANVSQGFYNLLMLDDQLKIARQNLALNDSTLLVIQLEYKSGQVTALAIQQAEAQRQTAAQLVPQFEQEILIQENALSILTGKLPSSIERNTILDQVNITDTLSTGVPSSIVGRRPDVKNYELQLDIANANVGIAKANMYPSLIITAQGGVNSFKASNWFNIPASLFGAVAGSLTQPLFQHKQLQTQFELAKIEREKAVIDFRQSVLNAVGEVSDALAKIEKLKAQKTIAESKVNTLQLAIKNAALLFESGKANYLEIITAQSNALQSELDLAIIKREQLDAAVELYKSLGGGRS